MNEFNFNSKNEDFLSSGLDFSKPVVVAVEPAQSGRGFNALIVQKLINVPSSKEGTSVQPANAILAKIKQASFDLSGTEFAYFGRTFQWYDNGKEPQVGDVLTDYTIIAYDTTNVSDLEGIILKPENSVRQNKAGETLTVSGLPVYRVHLLSKTSDNLSHVVLKVDAKEAEIKEIQRSASKIS
jgi:hypothetical protein